MSTARLSLLSVIGAILLASFWAGWLRHERSAEAEALRLDNARLQSNASLPRPVPIEPARAIAPEAPVPPVARGEPLDSAADYRFQGQATPVDTLQTLAWAVDQGDVELMMNVITFDAPARVKLDAYRTTLPPDARVQWPTVELLAATLLTGRGISRPYPRTDLLARATVEPIAPDRVLVRLPGTPKDREVYQKVGDTWKWVITEALVDAYLAHVQREARR
jgi:hypothetical protein